MVRRPAAGQIRGDRAHPALTPATAVFPLFFTGLHQPAVHPDYQKRRSVGHRRRAASLLVGTYLRITPHRHTSTDRLRPTLNLLAVQMRAPILIERLRRLIESVQHAFPGHPPRRS